MTGSICCWFIAASEEFKWGHQCWHEEAKHGVYPANVTELDAQGRQAPNKGQPLRTPFRRGS